MGSRNLLSDLYKCTAKVIETDKDCIFRQFNVLRATDSNIRLNMIAKGYH